jgi:HSP20 family molecular chaperone IbpA
MTTYLRELSPNGLTSQLSTPFDILVRNFFDSDSLYNPIHSAKLKHPIDVFEDKDGLHLDVACTGLTKDDISLDIEGDILKVGYNKEDTDETPGRDYYYQGIAKRSFNFGYKVAPRFNLSKAEAEMENGLLNITVPYSSNVTSVKTVKIK